MMVRVMIPSLPLATDKKQHQPWPFPYFRWRGSTLGSPLEVEGAQPLAPYPVCATPAIM